ncbi:MAG TPA: CRISPR-associated protein Csx18 [Allocoleopsis sp.]
MNISKRSLFVRNLAVAGVNGITTLIILLIAPLGLVAVIVNTCLVTLSTFVICSLVDGVMVWLLPHKNHTNLSGRKYGNDDLPQVSHYDEITRD